MKTLARIVTTAVCLLTSNLANASAAETLWRFQPSDKIIVTDVVADEDGNAHLCGRADSPDSAPYARRIGPPAPLPTQSDAFYIKIGPNGELLSAVRWGGEGQEEAQKIAVDFRGQATVLGYTTSTQFPVLGGVQSNLVGGVDLFVTQFDTSGTNLVFSTYLGGTGYDMPYALKDNFIGDILIAAQAGPSYLPDNLASEARIGGLTGTFLACLSNDGSVLRFSRHFGGSGNDSVTGMDVDWNGNIFLTGTAASRDFPILNAVQPESRLTTDFSPYGFPSAPYVAKLDAEGNLLFSTFLAGNGRANYIEKTIGIVFNWDGDVVVAGNTPSPVFPALTPVPADLTDAVTNRAFLVTLAGDGSAVLATNFLPSADWIQMRSLAISLNGEAVAAATVGGSLGWPAFVHVPRDGGPPLVAYDTACEPSSEFRTFAVDPENRLVTVGNRISGNYPNFAGTVVRYTETTWHTPGPPHVRLLSPRSGMIEPLTQPSYLHAEVLGATGSVSSVKFYDGRRLLGIATNPPFAIEWKRKTRGLHRLKAVAMVDGLASSSCVNPVTVFTPRNDNFASRTRLGGSRVSILGDTRGASSEHPFENPNERTVWYSWRAPASGLYDISVSATDSSSISNFETTLYLGSRPGSLERIADFFDADRSRTKIRARRGDVFQIQVKELYGSPNAFTLRLRQVTPPANDHFENAIALTSPTTITIPDFSSASTQYGEQRETWYYHPNAANPPTIWYSWTAPSYGLHLISVSSAGYPPTVRCYTGTALNSLAEVGQQITGDTNGCAIDAVAGTRYWLQLTAADTNAVTLRIAPHNAPANDHFANRIAIPFGVNSATGSLIGATMEIGEAGPYFPGSSVAGSVWWTWTAPAAGAYEVILQSLIAPRTNANGARLISPGRFPDRSVGVYRGSSLSDLVSVGKGDFRSFTTTFRAEEAGEDFQVSANGGDARFAIHFLPLATPTNDAFGNATPIVGARIFQNGTTRGATIEAGERYRTPALPRPGETYDQSVWYRWIAPSNGVFVFSSTAGLLELYGGFSLESLTLVVSGAAEFQAAVMSGIEYHIAVVGDQPFTLGIRTPRRPANDHFANAQVVTGMNPRLTGDITDATLESGEPVEYGTYASRSVWFTWTAPTNGMFRARAVTGSLVPLSIYTGNTVSNLSLFARVVSSDGPDFPVRSGTTYQVAVKPEGYHPVPIGFDLELTLLPPVPNDHFTNRIRLTGESISITASNIGATLEPGETRHQNVGDGQSVWWTWTAPRTGRATFAVGNYSAAVSLYTGTNLAELSAVTDTNLIRPAINVRVEAGTAYQISVDRSIYGSTGYFDFRIHYTSSPANDNFDSMRPFGGHGEGSSEGGSFEPGEPSRENSSWTASTWWRWTAPSNGVARFTLRSFPVSLFAGEVQLYTGTALTNLQSIEMRPWYLWGFHLFPVIAGQTYAIRVLGENTTAVGYILSASYATPPVNDDFDQRLTVTGTFFTASGSNITATAEAGEPSHGSNPASQSIWWTWTAPATGEALVSQAYSQFNPIAIYSGTALTNLVRIAASNGIVRFNAVSNSTYHIAIDEDAWSYSYDGIVHWTLSLPAPPAPPPIVRPPRTIPPLPPPPTPFNPEPAPRVVETSTNLIDWVRYTNAPADPAEFRVVPATNEPRRFFRIR